jgi:hypothetical protein
MSVYFCCLFRYRLSPETFGCTLALVCVLRVNLSRCLSHTSEECMGGWGGVDVKAPRSDHCFLRNKSTGTHLIGSWWLPESVWTRCPCPESNPDRPTHLQLLFWLNYPARLTSMSCFRRSSYNNWPHPVLPNFSDGMGTGVFKAVVSALGINFCGSFSYICCLTNHIIIIYFNSATHWRYLRKPQIKHQ